MFREQIPEGLGWHNYLLETAEGFCPYLEHSLKNESANFSFYDLSRDGDPEETAFVVMLVHTELLRKIRWRVSKPNKVLLCENVIFNLQSPNEWSQELLLNWIHWALKVTYTKRGLLFGKFWPDENKRSRANKLIPDPPMAFLSIRSTVGEVDSRFFDSTAQLRDDHLTSRDDGKRVLAIEENQQIEKVVRDILDDTDYPLNAQDLLRDCRSIAKSCCLRKVLSQQALYRLVE